MARSEGAITPFGACWCRLGSVGSLCSPTARCGRPLGAGGLGFGRRVGVGIRVVRLDGSDGWETHIMYGPGRPRLLQSGHRWYAFIGGFDLIIDYFKSLYAL